MTFEYQIVEVSTSSWQEIMDSDDADLKFQHLNKFGKDGWELDCVVPKLENGTTVGYGMVFKRLVD
ncbi:MAG TPA: DUF4177 domain-containing protein [bacterium]|jgi:hypothetical protein